MTEEERIKERNREYSRRWVRKNPDKVKERSKRWQEANPEKAKEISRKWIKEHPERMKELGKKWRRDNVERKRETERKRAHANPEKYRLKYRKSNEKRRSTPQGRLHIRIGNMLRNGLKTNKAGRKWDSLVNYSVEDLKKHIEKQFKKYPGMNWDRFMAGDIHIDHIIPQAAFNYEKPEDVDFIKCWSLSNLQPMWAKENLSKGAKLKKPFQPSLIFQGE